MGEKSVTEQVWVRAALRESEERFRTVFEFAPIAMAIVNAEGRFVQTNHALHEMLGYTQDELQSTVFTDFIHADDVEDGLRQFRELLEGKRDHFRAERRYYRKDGRLVWGHGAVSVVRDANGEIQHVIAMCEDNTERVRAEAELKARARQQAAVAELGQRALAGTDLSMPACHPGPPGHPPGHRRGSGRDPGGRTGEPLAPRPRWP